jgi:hypothetical protein
MLQIQNNWIPIKKNKFEQICSIVNLFRQATNNEELFSYRSCNSNIELT